MSCYTSFFYMSDFLKEVNTKNDLADYIGVSVRTLTYILYGAGPDNLYTTFEIPKKAGGTRQISAPAQKLKSVQRKLSLALQEEQRVIYLENDISPNIAHGFVPGKSIITNAKIHSKKKYVINVDLEHFFDCFTFSRVRGYFEKNRNFQLPYNIAVMIAQLTCYDGRLPQGAPTSPIITNLICQILDYRILNLAKEYKLDYTRYADDLTFSTNDKHFLDLCPDFLMGLDKLVKKAGFAINWDKYRLQYKDSRQSVTGLVVNDKINVTREFYKTTKSMAHELYKSGKYEILDPAGKKIPGTINQLEGRFAFIDSIVHYNNSLDDSKHKINELSSFERQYRYFLFYKYFYANETPIIVTEGKTDILYIKAALKQLYDEYPNLVEKKEDGSFAFKISFLHRTNRLTHFLGLVVDGADGLGSLCQTFCHKDDTLILDCFQYIYNLRKAAPKNPVILLFDNEKKSKDKPLYKFFASDSKKNSECGSPFRFENQKKYEDNLRTKDDVEYEIITKYFSKLFLLRNVYVATFPLPNEMKEAEIENLFYDNDKPIVINGKTFSKQSSFDKSKFYSKDTLSKHLYKHYDEYDLSGMRPLLDVLKSIISDYSNQKSTLNSNLEKANSKEEKMNIVEEPHNSREMYIHVLESMKENL